MRTIKNYSLVLIRYNTNKSNKQQNWTILCDGVEYPTDKLVIRGTIQSSHDLLPSGEIEHQIKNAVVDYSVDYTLIESNNKFLFYDILKTITYRILGTSVTFGIGFISTGNLNVAVALGFSDLILKPLVYFVHERLWRLSRN